MFLANEQKREDMDKFASMLITLKGELSDRIEFWGCDVKFSEGARTAGPVKIHNLNLNTGGVYKLELVDVYKLFN